MKTHRWVVGMLFVIVVHSLGCSYFQAAGEKNRVIRMEMERYVYDEPCERVFPELRQVLFQDGYAVRNTGEGGMTLETEWTRDRSDNDRRYLAQGIATQSQGCQLRVSFEQISAAGNRQSGRDTDMELRVLQRVDPTDHAEILRKAEAAYQASVSS